MVADKSDRQHNNTDKEDEDREVPGSSWAKAPRSWRDAIMWRC